MGTVTQEIEQWIAEHGSARDALNVALARLKVSDEDAEKFISGMWRKIILKHQPDYGDWEYPAQAHRHILAEFDDLRASLATVTAERNEAFNVGTALEADLTMARKLVDDLAEEVWYDAGPDGGYTILDADLVGQTPEYQQQHKELLRRVNVFLRSTRAAQPEPPATGTQIIYVPIHADGLDHPDCETGFVLRSDRSPIHGFVYCRYWSKHSPGELRTKAGSELTPIDLIVVKDTVPQQQVEDTMQELIEAEKVSP